MRKLGIIAAVLALGFGTWVLVHKSEPKKVASLTESIPAEVTEVTDTSKPELKTESNPKTKPQPKATSASVSPSTEPLASPVHSTPPPSQPNCYTYEFRHLESAKEKDIEDFLDFSNAFPIAHENINKKSICVKVNQKPVEFQVLKLKTKQEIVIGPVVGPESVIRVSYCTGNAACREACTPQKKRFMDDLLSEAQADDFKDSWGKAAKDGNTQELKAKTKELSSIARDHGSLNDRAMMRDWNTLQKQEWTCKEK